MMDHMLCNKGFQSHELLSILTLLLMPDKFPVQIQSWIYQNKQISGIVDEIMVHFHTQQYQESAHKTTDPALENWTNKINGPYSHFTVTLSEQK